MANTKLPARLLDTSAVPALNVTGDLTVDTTTLKVDSSNNRVKIGDTAVASATNAPLHVAKSSTDVQAIFGDNNTSIDDPSIRIIGRDTGNSAIRYMFAGLDADANHGFVGYNHGSGSFVNALNFDTSGNVGIGTESPQDKLHVYDGDVGIENSSGRRYRLIAEAGGGFTIRDQTASAGRLAIDTSGNIGIGESTPLASLHIKQGDSGLSSINAAAHHIFLEDTGANGPGMTMASGTTSNCTLAFGDSDSNYQGFILYDNSADTFKIGTGGTGEKLSINSNGYVIMSHAASEYGLELRSTGTRSGLVIATPNSGNTIKASALLLADDTYRLGTQSVYNIHMYQSGYVTKPNQAYARMSKSTHQSINNWTKITFDSSTGTSSSSWSTTNNRFTIPISGRYLFDARVRYETGITYNYMGFYINGSPYAYNQGSQTTFGPDTTIGGIQIIDLNSADYIELYAYSPTSVNITGGSTRTYMSVWLLG